MSSCDNNVNINIKDLPQVFNIASGDFLIVENDQGTNIIDFKDIIITPEQTSFSTGLSTLTTAVNTLSAELKIVSNAALPSIMNVRLSLDPNTPTPTTSRINLSATNLYIHPYKGDVVTLYNTTLSAWQVYDFNTPIATSIRSICDSINTTYDIYLSVVNDTFTITSRPWTNQNPGINDFQLPTETQFIDGVALHPSDRSKRLIGCLRTTTAGTSEYSFGNTAGIGVSGSHPRFFVWNMYNRQPEPFSILDNGSGGQGWVTTNLGGNAPDNGPFEMFGGSNSFNRVSFITREPVVLNLTSTHLVSGINADPYYFAYSLNDFTPTVSDIFASTPGAPIMQGYSAAQPMVFTSTLRIPAGYHFVQLVTMTTLGQNYRFYTWREDRNSFGTIGTIQDI